MKMKKILCVASRRAAALLLALCVPIALNNANAFQQDPPIDDQEVEILTRGPVHEAFAETVTFDPEPGIVVSQVPREAIEEVPPDQRPEGDNVNWIPGYWAWDDERTDFLWVSGIWRALPPGRQWVPGYWAPAGEGAQWTSGYWADAQITEVEFLPEPPATIEVGPNVTAPSVDHGWLPGCWVWQTNRYAWRPGYWAEGQADWNWIPAHYVWTPRGYVFVDGYYDYSIARRGVLYAPVYFRSNIYSQHGYSYSPVTVVNPAVFANHLFLRSNYCHYYYGDYYGANYVTAGYSPWYSYSSSQYGYEPFYAQQRWLHRQDRQWEQNIHSEFQNRVINEDARPPRTWADQRARLSDTAKAVAPGFVIAAPLSELAKTSESLPRLQPLEKNERQQFAQHQRTFRDLRKQRQTLEDQPVNPLEAESKPPREVRITKGKLPESPIVALPPDRLSGDKSPPKRHDAPKPDLKVAPTARNPGANPNPVRERSRRTTIAPQGAPKKTESAELPHGETKENAGGVEKSPPGESNEDPQPTPQGKPKNESKDKPGKPKKQPGEPKLTPPG